MAANHMRTILVDHARRKQTNKGVSQAEALSLNEALAIDAQDSTVAKAWVNQQMAE